MGNDVAVHAVDNTGKHLPKVQVPEQSMLDLNEAADYYWTTIDTGSDEGKRRVLAAFDEPTLVKDDLLGHPITLTDALQHWTDMVDRETGEVARVIRTVLFDADGKTIAFIAASIVKSFKLICDLYGHAPWRPGLTVVITRRTLPGGHLIYRVQVPDKGMRPKVANKR